MTLHLNFQGRAGKGIYGFFSISNHLPGQVQTGTLVQEHLYNKAVSPALGSNGGKVLLEPYGE